MDDLQLVPQPDRRGAPGVPKSPEHRARISEALKRRNQETTVIVSESRCEKCAAIDNVCADHRSAKLASPMCVVKDGNVMWVGKWANPTSRKARLAELEQAARKTPKLKPTPTPAPARKTSTPLPVPTSTPTPTPAPYVAPLVAGDMPFRVDSHMRVHYDAPPKSKDKPKTVRVPEVETDDGRRTIRKGDA